MSGGRILVVDDSPEQLLVIGRILERHGFEVDKADSGEAAVMRFSTQPYDLVILDVMMPGLGGLATCDLLRAMPGGASLPVIFLTADRAPRTVERALDAEADDFLEKPVRPLELLMRVQSLLRIARLNRKLRENYATMAAQYVELQKLAAEKDELRELVVHDLKTPLSVIMSNAEFVLDGDMDGASREALVDVKNASQRMMRMIVDIMEIGRENAGGLSVRRESLAVAPLIREQAGSLTHRLALYQQRMEVEIADEPLQLVGDGDLVTRILQNLLDNAIRHAPAGGAIRVRAATCDGAIRVSVEDDGPGVPDDAKHTIFEKYRQAPGASRERGNRGLGLWFCRVAVQAHGGRIWVEDAAPGAVFCFELPSANAAA